MIALVPRLTLPVHAWFQPFVGSRITRSWPEGEDSDSPPPSLHSTSPWDEGEDSNSPPASIPSPLLQHMIPSPLPQGTIPSRLLQDTMHSRLLVGPFSLGDTGKGSLLDSSTKLNDNEGDVFNDPKFGALDGAIQDILCCTLRRFIWLSKAENWSFINRAKRAVEAYTNLEFSWWPLEKTWRPLREDEMRLMWKCVSVFVFMKLVKAKFSSPAENIYGGKYLLMTLNLSGGYYRSCL